MGLLEEDKSMMAKLYLLYFHFLAQARSRVYVYHGAQFHCHLINNLQCEISKLSDS